LSAPNKKPGGRRVVDQSGYASSPDPQTAEDGIMPATPTLDFVARRLGITCDQNPEITNKLLDDRVDTEPPHRRLPRKIGVRFDRSDAWPDEGCNLAFEIHRTLNILPEQAHGRCKMFRRDLEMLAPLRIFDVQVQDITHTLVLFSCRRQRSATERS
jgi:hypothetical protein